MKFSEYIKNQQDDLRKAGEGYEALSDLSKNVIDYAVQRFIDEQAGKKQSIAFANFIAKHDIKPHDYDTWNGGMHNTHEVYDDFIQEQLKEQQSKP